MQEGKQKSAAPVLTILVLIQLAALPLLYVLSIGPAAWLFLNHRLSGDTFDRLYWPLQALSANVDVFREFMNWYISFFDQ